MYGRKVINILLTSQHVLPRSLSAERRNMLWEGWKTRSTVLVTVDHDSNSAEGTLV